MNYGYIKSLLGRGINVEDLTAGVALDHLDQAIVGLRHDARVQAGQNDLILLADAIVVRFTRRQIGHHVNGFFGAVYKINNYYTYRITYSSQCVR